MALTQSARMPGPSWDEEVVPALRKRLESESRTLARRISAISMSSNTEDPLTAFSSAAVFAEATSSHQKHQQNNYQQASSNQRPRPGYQQHPPTHSDRLSPPDPSTRVTDSQSTRTPVATSFHRSRTYSQPYATGTNGSAHSKTYTGRPGDTPRSPRLADAMPTRIPKASRVPSGPTQGAGSPPPVPYLNGVSHNAVTPPVQTPNLKYAPDFPSTDLLSTNSSQVRLGPSHSSRIINEPPPFSTTASMASSSGFSLHDNPEVPPRLSTDSEERPFEHWYRGEVSRNGGVGELRVGRRQEMLEIANYGHAINNKRRAVATRRAALLALEDSRRPRKRADSIAGIGTRGRERESLYLDDEDADRIARVLDEDPLTDLDDEGSDIGSISNHYRYTNHNADYDYIPGVGDITATAQESPTRDIYDTRSPTPTQSSIHRPKSRQNSSSSRIPAPSEPRSSESRVSTSTQQSGRGRAGPPAVTSTSSTMSPSPPPPLSSSTNSRTTQSSGPSTPSSTKRGVSPSASGSSSFKKSRTGTNPPKSFKSKVLTVKEAEEDKRRSVAHYPSPGEGEDMLYAIPSWTQPKLKERNWDDVVLPVVARKKGLDDQYEKADGSPQPKKQGQTPVAPAPGTFGYDDTKVRRGRGGFEDIQMDDFGQPGLVPPDRSLEDQPKPELETEYLHQETEVSVAHDNARVPIKPPPSPAPFAHYAPTVVRVTRVPPAGLVPQREDAYVAEQEEGGAGCCKCVIM